MIFYKNLEVYSSPKRLYREFTPAISKCQKTILWNATGDRGKSNFAVPRHALIRDNLLYNEQTNKLFRKFFNSRVRNCMHNRPRAIIDMLRVSTLQYNSYCRHWITGARKKARHSNDCHCKWLFRNTRIDGWTSSFNEAWRANLLILVRARCSSLFNSKIILTTRFSFSLFRFMERLTHYGIMDSQVSLRRDHDVIWM